MAEHTTAATTAAALQPDTDPSANADFMAGLGAEERALFGAVEEAVRQDDPSFRLDISSPPEIAQPAAEGAPAAPAAPVAAGEPAAPTPPPAPPAPVDLPPAQKAYLDRKARKEGEARLAQENQNLREAMAAIARGLDQRAQGQPADQQQEPAYNVDPELQAFLDDRDQRLMYSLQQMLAPVTQGAQQQQVQQQADAEVVQYRAEAVEFIREVDGMEREYAATPEGAGYFERAGALDKRLGEVYGGLVSMGADPSRVEQVVKANLVGSYKVAEFLGVNPAIYVDYMAKTLLGVGGNGNGQPQAQPAAQAQPQQRFPAAPSQQVSMAAQAQANGLVRSTPAATQTVDANNPDFIVDQLAAGTFSPATLEGWAKQGGDEAVIQNIMKVVGAAGRRG